MKVLVAGDFCPCGRVEEAIEKKEFASVLDEIRDVTGRVDYSIVNLECPVVNGDAKPILKQGPNLRCTSNAIEALCFAGFNCVSLANNHFLDFGGEGVSETLSVLDYHGIDHVGGGLNLREASAILYKEVCGQRLAIINCCEHEFSIATETSAGCNPLNLINQYKAIKEARDHADRVLVIVHGGHEHFRLPSLRMIETYHFLIDIGADAVVNHHQHCFSGYEIYKGFPIFYGLGNFCFDRLSRRDRKWTEGIMVSIDFERSNPSFIIHPYKQCADKGCVELLAEDAFADRIKDLNELINAPDSLKLKLDEYYSSCKDQYRRVFEPIRSRFVLGAIHRGWIPSLISKRRLLSMYNYMFCESHRDKLLYWLEESVNN